MVAAYVEASNSISCLSMYALMFLSRREDGILEKMYKGEHKETLKADQE